MAVPTKLISTSQGFQDAKGNVVANGLLSLTLSQAAEITASGGLVTTDPLYFALDVNGKITSTAIWFNDELTPSGTTYHAILYASNQVRIIQDFGQWSITGASADLSTMVPTATNVSQANAVLLNPAAAQHITTNNNLTTPVFNGIRVVDGTQFTTINAAENDLSTNKGLVIVPTGGPSGAGQSLLTKDNIFVLDLRSPASSAQQQSTNLLLNVVDTANGNVRSKMMLVDPVQPTASMQAGSSSASFYVHTFTEGNHSGYGTLEAINGTITVDTGATNAPTVVIGIEGEVFVSGTAANTIPDIRGATFNANLTGAGNVTTAAALRAQSVTNTGSGTVANAYGLYAEDQTAGTSTNLSIFAAGQTELVKSVGIGAAPLISRALFINSSNLQNGSQIGTQIAIVSSSAATVSATALLARADTAAAAFTQALNIGIEVATPTVGAGSSITEWNGILIDAAPTAGTKWAIKATGPENYSFGGKIGVYNGITTAGNGVPSVYAVTSQKSESAADTNVLTLTPPASAGMYRLSFVLDVSAATAATLGWTATWKDSNGNAQAPTNLSLEQSGIGAPALTFVLAASGVLYGFAVISVDNSATNIVIKLTFTGTSFTAKASAAIERII